MALRLIKKSIGFTLIELVLVIALVSIIALIGVVILNQGFHAYLDLQNTTTADGQLRIALETMGREIRNLRSPTDISVATATQYSFVDINGKSVSFSYSGGNLLENSQVLASGVSAMNFTYYNSELAQTTSASAVALVQLSITFTANNTSTTTQLIWFPRNTQA